MAITNFPECRPESVGMSANGLARIRAASQESIDNGLHVGTVSLVARRGKIVHFEAVGQLNREAGTPMPKDAIFRVYSNTKIFTSAAIMTLCEEGKLDLDDAVSRYLPMFHELKVGVEVSRAGEKKLELDEAVSMAITQPGDSGGRGEEERGRRRKLRLVPCHREMSVRDLLRHTSGLSYGWSDGVVDGLYRDAGVMARDRTAAETVDKLSQLPLRYQPGEVWEYSLSCEVLGRIAEIITGDSYDHFLQKRIFDPLGMQDTFFYVPTEKADRLAGNYRKGSTSGKAELVPPPDPARPGNPMWEPLKMGTYFSGGGGLLSTAIDHLKFCEMLRNGGRLGDTVILKPETTKIMFTNQLPAGVVISEFGKTMEMGKETFGLGFRLTPNPEGKIGYNVGWGGLAGTSVWLDPPNELVGIYMIQIYNNDGRNSFRKQVYSSLLDA